MSGLDTSAAPGPDDEPERAHPEDPAEGADEGAEPHVERTHPQDPAEGADDPEVTGA